MRKIVLIFIAGFFVPGYSQQKKENAGVSNIVSAEKYAVVNFESLPEDEWYVGIQRPEVERNQFSKYSSKKEIAPTNNQVAAKNELVQSAAATVIQLDKNFSGVTVAAYPPDNGTAISNGNYIVHAVNSRINIYDTLGTLLTTSKTLPTFFSKSSGTYLSDPRVIYDAYADRFIVLISEEFNRLLVAFSQSNNPLGNWNLYTIQVDGVTTGPVEFFDYPYPMVNEFELVVSGYVFSNLYTGTKIVQIKKANGYAGTTLTTRIWNNIVDADGNPAENFCAVNFAQQGVAYGKKIYFVGTYIAGYSKVFMFEITDTINGNPVLNSYAIPTTAYTPPPNTAQKNVTSVLETTDNRVGNAIFLNGIIHFAYAANNPATNTSRIVYNRLNASTRALTTSFYGSTTSNYAFPSLASFSNSSTDHSVVLCYLESNANMFPAVMAVSCDNAMAWGPPITVKAGTAHIGGAVGGVARWGDYTSAVRKHNAASPRVWVSGEFGIIASNNSNWIAEIKTGIGSGVQQIANEKNTASVFPNPVIDFFTLKLEMLNDTRVNVQVYDIHGKMIRDLYNGWAYKGETVVTFNKNAMAKGVYFVNVVAADDKNVLIKTEKIIIE